MKKPISRKTEFVLVSASYLIVTVLDLVLTYLATPNLHLEGNKLVQELDWGWIGLIAINIVTCAGYVGLSYYAFIGYKPIPSKERELKRYLADNNYGDPEKIVPLMWKLPKNWGPQIACMCWSVAVALPFSRLIIVTEWLLMILRAHAPVFFSIVAMFPGGRIDLFVAIALAWALSAVWIKNDFTAHLERLGDVTTDDSGDGDTENEVV